MTTKPRVCLNMIVKNESHIIRETLECVYKHIDYYVINDTGSTDNTIQIINEFFAEKNIPGEVVVHEFRTCTCHKGLYKKYSFFHFGWNRTYALELCAGKSEYIWVIDADDLPMGDFIIPQNLTADSYMLRIGQNFTYMRNQIFKNDTALAWHYVGPLHEYPTTKKANATCEAIKGDYFIDSRRMGARSANPNKYLNDAKVFEEFFPDDPNKDRNIFYCAQSYFDHGDTRKSIEMYQRRIAMGKWYEEVYYSYYRIAEGLERLEEPWHKIEQAYLDAYNFCKDRAEPLCRIATHYRIQNDFQKCYSYAKKGATIPYPEKCLLFITKDVYTYKCKDELAIAAHYLGKYLESYSICKQLLDSNSVPDHEIERIKANMISSEAKLNDKNKKMCCFYLGNELLSQDYDIYNIIDHCKKYFKVIVIGNKIDPSGLENVLCFTPTVFKKFMGCEKIDQLILVNSLNYFYDNIKIQCENIVLLHNDVRLSIHLDSDMLIEMCNRTYLNELFKNVKKIVCFKENIKEFSAFYKFDNDIKCINTADDYYLIYDDDKYNYIFTATLENETNGLIYVNPPHIVHLLNNLDMFQNSKLIVTEHYREVLTRFPSYRESHYLMAALEDKMKNYASAITHIDNGLKISKKIVSYDDVLLIKKAELLNKQDRYEDSYNCANTVLCRDNLPISLRDWAEKIRDVNVDMIKDKFLSYPKKKIMTIANKTDRKIMFSITTCKRYDLFEKTMNSFINTCLDLDMIDHWLCVDDNSTAEDRAKMKKSYPFFEFVLKGADKKGHPVSMNIIHIKTSDYKCQYNLHMEDDFHFIQKRNYISESLKIMQENKMIGQVLFNKNYAEVELYKRGIRGGILNKTKDGMRYVVHEYYEKDTQEYAKFIERHEGHGTCGYWPHFSFRPSLLRVSMLQDVGIFYNTNHFEMQYAYEYVSKNYVSAFLDTFSCIHIGKKTWETNVSNSYSLNDLGQFDLKNKFISISILSDAKNVSQWKKFKDNAHNKLPHYTRKIFKTATTLNDYEKKLFLNNEFNYSRQIIANIMDHVNILNDECEYKLVLRDKLTLAENFESLFSETMKTMAEHGYDFLLLDHPDTMDDKIAASKFDCPKLILEKMDGYIISKAGAKKILDHINEHGIKKTEYLNKNLIDVYVLNKQLYKVTGVGKKIGGCNFVNIPGYKFYSQMDSFGGDDCFHSGKTPGELRQLCDSLECKAFNTLGYIKKTVVAESDFIYLPQSQFSHEGLYVKKN
uniref:Glycosyltransferase 2-like domain-containing protein n=1 Tax=viral metagenome TaxID=1070528 RepID=A0A6C0C970_9ZZZZ